jgi:hypothetical protein
VGAVFAAEAASVGWDAVNSAPTPLSSLRRVAVAGFEQRERQRIDLFESLARNVACMLTLSS